MARVRISENGSVPLPQAVRDAHGWKPGAELEIVDGGRGVVLQPVEAEQEVPAKKTLTIEEFLAMRPKYDGPPITDEMIEQAVLEEAKRRWDEKNSR
ncbi:AbrB/MazE/SpoVT family DNA-binding domain-containing protein [Rhizobium sp. 16-449-1b]|uniref:AbrB/MazE/SpoVT family DNA-binding domain-containing protein n=1 Tax=Rhizobium sp. 16-449-1b TaxID=2819989 RepID=UPI001ADD4B8F|nr:AbrB/MazE/SpoVT family DNA-binding domain-containing protein [Rhizobium sp. 16-449-1b]MBO9194637.1 AbrB/MazE/SpoVT family DNA-binding domain-containing protein [Rhizobium sp. 16-449-1b]